MKKNELVFLIAVAVVAVAFTVLTFSHASRVLTWESGLEETIAPTAGKARDVDLDRVRQQLRQRTLSEREALYYKKIGDRIAPEGEGR